MAAIHHPRNAPAMKEFLRGFRSIFQAHKLISANKLWPYVLTPALVSMLISPVVIYLYYIYFSRLSRYVNEHWLPPYLQSGIAEVMITILFWLIGLVLFFVSIRSLIMVIFSPLLGVLSEKTESIYRGSLNASFSVKQVAKDVMRSLVFNGLLLGVFLVLLVIAWLLVFIPLAGVIVSPTLIFLLESYFGGVGFIDPSLERHRYSVRQSFAYSWKHKLRITGIGTGFTLLMFIPIIGWFLAPPYGVVAATISYLDLEDRY